MRSAQKARAQPTAPNKKIQNPKKQEGRFALASQIAALFLSQRRVRIALLSSDGCITVALSSLFANEYDHRSVGRSFGRFIASLINQEQISQPTKHLNPPHPAQAPSAAGSAAAAAGAGAALAAGAAADLAPALGLAQGGSM